MIEAGFATRGTVRVMAVLLALVAAGLGPTAAGDERGAVKKAYRSYRETIMKDLGEISLRYVCGTTLDYFGELRDLALYARKDELTARPLIDQLQALQFRLMVPPDDLQAMSSSELFAHAVDNGWVLKNSVKQSALGGIMVTDGRAAAAIMMAGKPAGGKFHFCNEDGDWKFDLLTVIEHSGTQLEGVARHQGVSGEKMVLRVLAGATGEEVPSKVWKPRFKRK